MIDAALAKLTEMGIYIKAIEKWYLLNKTTWLEFRLHMIKQYERMLTVMETQGTTTGMGGYGTALNATEQVLIDDGSIATLNESVVLLGTSCDPKLNELVCLEFIFVSIFFHRNSSIGDPCN